MSAQEIPLIHSLDELYDSPSVAIGSVVTMDYETALIASNDFNVQQANGLARRTFLLAVPQEDQIIEEVVLLSISGKAELETSRAFQSLRENFALAPNHPTVDELTRANLQNIGFSCQVVGAFYRDEMGTVRFGSDVDRIRGNSLFRVFKPQGRSLSLISSYGHGMNSDPLIEEKLLEVGLVRYSETQLKPDLDAKVFINVEDFVGKKTGVLGMSRSGKSNSIKTILQKVHAYSHDRGKPVAQLIFDPQGEYANDNPQDGDALANVGDASEVSIYKVLAGEPTSDKVHPLQYNLFADENLELTWELFKQELANRGTDKANYVARLSQMLFLQPNLDVLQGQERKSAYVHWNRKKLGLYALMFHGVGDHRIKPFYVGLGRDLVEKLVEDLEHNNIQKRADDSNEVKLTSTREASKVMEWIMANKALVAGISDSWARELEDGDVAEFMEQIVTYTEKGYTGVIAGFRRIMEFHSPHAKGDIRENVWRDVQAGKLIIVDLSKGSPKATQTLSETIVHYLVGQASLRFTAGQPMIPFQIVVEEAHNLFERDSSKTDADPWVRLSKEAAKYSIGLLYSTQEVTSVDQRILSNTSNWLITHLNSKIETNELAKYYGFEEWGDHLRRVETKGFARLKTESSPFIIPVQIERFQARRDRLSRPAKLPKRPTEPSSPAVALDDEFLDSVELELF